MPSFSIADDTGAEQPEPEPAARGNSVPTHTADFLALASCCSSRTPQCCGSGWRGRAGPPRGSPRSRVRRAISPQRRERRRALSRRRCSASPTRASRSWCSRTAAGWTPRRSSPSSRRSAASNNELVRMMLIIFIFGSRHGAELMDNLRHLVEEWRREHLDPREDVRVACSHIRIDQ